MSGDTGTGLPGLPLCPMVMDSERLRGFWGITGGEETPPCCGGWKKGRQTQENERAKQAGLIPLFVISAD